jgi:hypothetical protein
MLVTPLKMRVTSRQVRRQPLLLRRRLVMRPSTPQTLPLPLARQATMPLRPHRLRPMLPLALAMRAPTQPLHALPPQRLARTRIAQTTLPSRRTVLLQPQLRPLTPLVTLPAGRRTMLMLRLLRQTTRLLMRVKLLMPRISPRYMRLPRRPPRSGRSTQLTRRSRYTTLLELLMPMRLR